MLAIKATETKIPNGKNRDGTKASTNTTGFVNSYISLGLSVFISNFETVLFLWNV